MNGSKTTCTPYVTKQLSAGSDLNGRDRICVNAVIARFHIAERITSRLNVLQYRRPKSTGHPRDKCIFSETAEDLVAFRVTILC